MLDLQRGANRRKNVKKEVVAEVAPQNNLIIGSTTYVFDARESKVSQNATRKPHRHCLARSYSCIRRIWVAVDGAVLVDTRQIEAARSAINRYMKRRGKMWIRVFPDKSFSKKPLETRMGKGKGRLKPGLLSFALQTFCLKWRCHRSHSPRGNEIGC